jgi:hypothetical protein
MSIETILGYEAAHIAKTMQGVIPELEAELREIEERKIEISTKLNAAKFAQKHLLDFRPRISEDFQCPRCWLQNETRSALVRVPGTNTDDILRCHACGSEYLIPLR